MQICLLGEIRLVARGGAVEIGPSRRQAVLAALAADAPQPVLAETIIDRVWGEQPPDSARDTLFSHISRIRRLVPVKRAAAGYALQVDDGVVDIDIRLFRRRVEQARAIPDLAERVELLSLALGLWQGTPLSGIPGRWADAFRDHWHQQRIDTALLWAEAALEAGQLHTLMDVLPRLAAEYPFVELLEALMLRALHAGGRAAQALDRYGKVRRRLVDELGVEPGPRLRAAHRELLHATAGGERDGKPEPDIQPHTREWAPFVGRSGEVATARAAWARGGILLVEGEAGVGKTRFADEVAQLVSKDGGRVLWGACRESYTIAFQPIVEALSTPAAVRDLAALLPESTRDTLSWVVPQLRPALAHGVDDVGAERRRSALFAAVAEALGGLARLGGLLLVLEDLHWATTPTLQLLDYLASVAAPPRTLIAITLRDPPADLADLLGRVRRLPQTHEAALGGLSLAEVGALAEALRVTDRDPLRLLQDTGGNPLLLGEVLMRSNVDSVSMGVREHVRARTAGLPEPVREALDWAAVIGEDVELSLLAEALGVPDIDVLLLMEAAVTAGLLRETGPGLFSFVHALIRRALLDGRSASRLAMQRARVADALEGSPSLAPQGRLARLAAYRLAEVVPGAERTAAETALAAAKNAMAELAYEDAITLAAAGRAALTAGPPQAADLPVLAELWLIEAQAAIPLSRHQQRVAATKAAATLARQLGSCVLLARAASLGLGRWAHGKLDLEMAELAWEALACLGDGHPALRAQLTAALAGAVASAGESARQWWGPPAQGLASEALALARTGGGREALVRTLFARLVTLFGQPNLAEQLRLADELIGLNEREGLRWRAPLRLITGDRPGFEADLARMSVLAPQWHDNHLLAFSLQFQAMLALLDCDFDRAAQIAMQSNMVGQGHPDFVNAHQTQMFWSHFERGELAAFEAIALRAQEVNPELPVLRAQLAFIYAHLGRPEVARPILEELAADDFAALPRDITWQIAIAGAAEAATLLGERKVAASAAELLAPYSGQLMLAAGGAFCFGAVDRILGMAAAAQGDPVAERHFAAALALEGSISDALRLRTLWWQWHLGRPPARQEAEAAVALARRLGLTDLARRLEQIV